MLGCKIIRLVCVVSALSVGIVSCAKRIDWSDANVEMLRKEICTNLQNEFKQCEKDLGECEADLIQCHKAMDYFMEQYNECLLKLTQ